MVKPNTSVVTQKGQITIPVEIRRALGIKTNDRLVFTIEGGRVCMEPISETLESISVIAEIVSVLSSRRAYALPRVRIKELLQPILHPRGLTLEHRNAYLRALDLYAAHTIDFEDAIAVAHMERLGITGILSYDHHFDELPGISRVEP